MIQNMSKYYVGLDIGTNSLGWAVSNENGEILKYKRRPMAGTVLIQSAGQTAAERRSFRASRRRLSRRKQRIQWLQELIGPIILKDDPNFFERLKYSYVSKEDTTCNINPEILFDNEFYKTHAYHENFPTIYHLRKAIMDSDHKIDIRLVYLAIHHIVKYRGNFLYEGQNVSVENLNIRDLVYNMLVSLGCIEEDESTILVDLIETELRATKRKGEKKDAIEVAILDYVPEEIAEGKRKAWAKTVSSLIMGYKADISVLFGLEEKKSVSFYDENFADAEEAMTDTQITQFEAIQKVYSGQVLISILTGNVCTLSDAYISVYDAHAKDLGIIKKLLKEFSTQETYGKLINCIEKNAKSYANYINSTRSCSNEDLCKAIKSELLKMPQENDNVKYCLSRIEDEVFLLKPRNSNNGAIPNQLHCEELNKILKNQTRFYPELKDISEKIMSIASFRIPYYVGPLSTKSPFSWIVRTEEKIMPWNFYDVVDTKKTAEGFIRRMTNKCTYLVSEDVLPKKSLLYSEFTVLDELSNVCINNHHISPDCKNAIFRELFLKHKVVTITMFKNWYRTYIGNSGENFEVSGLSDPAKFTSNMSSFVELSNILGTLDTEEKVEQAERIIEFVTLFEDKKILEAEIRELLPDVQSIQVSKLLKLNYAGWGRISKKLLTGIYSSCEDTEPKSIMDILRSTEQNFMQIIFNKKYNFESVIESENLKNKKEKSTKDLIEEYPGSPAIKKCTSVAVRVIEEIESILGSSPSDIFVEVASGDEKKKRTSSRYNSLYKTYSNINDDDFKSVYEELKAKKGNPKDLDRKALYLYFIQNGKCLYSGDPLDIQKLSDYQIDHILPRCYIKDDSIDNLALVKSKENQRKLDSLVLKDQIIDEQRTNWEHLLKYGLISKKKFDNLCRRSIDDNVLSGFINRQLVETRQICTNVFSVLKMVYKDKINVYGVSAKLSYNLKQRIGLVKLRELNDFHHAVDAYTAILAGSFSQKQLSVPYGELNSFYRQLIRDEGSERRARYGIIAELFCSLTSTWDGPKHQIDLVNISKRHDFFINCLIEEQTGAFYNQIPLPKDNNPEKLIPRKHNLPTSLYGGYTGEQDAYFCLIKDGAKPKKKAYSIVGIPIRIATIQLQNKNAIDDYLKSQGITEPIILKDKIKKYQHIEYADGNDVDDFYIVAAKEVINAKQLWLTDKAVRYLDSILHQNYERKQQIDEFQISYLYNEICERIIKYYPCYRKIGIACKDYYFTFMELPLSEKVKHIENLLTVTHANSKRVDDWDRQTVDGNKTKMKIQSSRLSKTLKPENIIFIDSSITGMHSRRYRIEL